MQKCNGRFINLLGLQTHLLTLGFGVEVGVVEEVVEVDPVLGVPAQHAHQQAPQLGRRAGRNAANSARVCKVWGSEKALSAKKLTDPIVTYLNFFYFFCI